MVLRCNTYDRRRDKGLNCSSSASSSSAGVVRIFIARVVIAPGRLLRDILAEIARGRLGIVIRVEGAEESGSVLTFYLIFFFIPFPFLIGAFRTGVSVKIGLGERIRGYLGC
jgi:hypothetical protein